MPVLGEVTDPNDFGGREDIVLCCRGGDTAAPSKKAFFSGLWMKSNEETREPFSLAVSAFCTSEHDSSISVILVLESASMPLAGRWGVRASVGAGLVPC